MDNSKEKPGPGRGLRACLRLAAALVVLGVGAWLVSGWIGFRPFPEPPKVGEKIEDVIARIGEPHYDSRDAEGVEQQKDGEYRLGYTGGVWERGIISWSETE